jgi:Ulp1 family protease
VKQGGIFGLDHIVIPINPVGLHWVVVRVDVKGKAIYYYDSRGEIGTGDFYVHNIFEYLKKEHEDKFSEPLPNPEKWKCFAAVCSLTPRQGGGVDCGVFVCMYVYCTLLRIPFDAYSQVDMPNIRRRMMLAILEGNIADE